MEHVAQLGWIILIIISAWLTAYRRQLMQYKSAFEGKLPKWWPKESLLGKAVFIINTALILGGIATILYIVFNKCKGCIIEMLFLSTLIYCLGFWISLKTTSKIIRKRAEKMGVNLLPECF